MLRKIPEIEQPFVPYNEQYNACFINYEKGHVPEIAPGVVINGLVDCLGLVTIEKDVFTGHDITILTGEHDYTKFGKERRDSYWPRPVRIREGAWLASRCIIMPGVTVGKHAVVGAGSVINKDVPPYELWIGNPGRCVKRYNHEKKEWERV